MLTLVWVEDWLNRDKGTQLRGEKNQNYFDDYLHGCDRWNPEELQVYGHFSISHLLSAEAAGNWDGQESVNKISVLQCLGNKIPLEEVLCNK